MVARLREKGVDVDEANGRNLGPTIGAHIGPGCCGAPFYKIGGDVNQGIVPQKQRCARTVGDA